MYKIEDFKEVLNHEFPEYTDIKTLSEGYRVDGEGIKFVLKLNELKSVDYFMLSNMVDFLEYSDIFKQRECQLVLKGVLEDSDLDSKAKKDIKKTIDRKINKEIIDKLKDSIHIKRKADVDILNTPLIGEVVSTLIIAIAPIKENQSKSDFVRYLDQLKSNIVSGLPNEFLTRVVIKPIDQLSFYKV